jgi:hypothetical protein
LITRVSVSVTSSRFPWKQCCGSESLSTYLPDADPDPDFIDAGPNPTFHPHADPDTCPGPSFQIKSQTLEKVLKQAHIPYILACHLQIDRIWIRFRIQLKIFYADPGYQNDADPDPDLQHCLEE